MPIDQLLAMYGYGSSGTTVPEPQDTRSSSEEEILSNQVRFGCAAKQTNSCYTHIVRHGPSSAYNYRFQITLWIEDFQINWQWTASGKSYMRFHLAVFHLTLGDLNISAKIH